MLLADYSYNDIENPGVVRSSVVIPCCFDILDSRNDSSWL